jgi:hypothetical protein
VSERDGKFPSHRWATGGRNRTSLAWGRRQSGHHVSQAQAGDRVPAVSVRTLANLMDAVHRPAACRRQRKVDGRASGSGPWARARHAPKACWPELQATPFPVTRSHTLNCTTQKKPFVQFGTTRGPPTTTDAKCGPAGMVHVQENYLDGLIVAVSAQFTYGNGFFFNRTGVPGEEIVWCLMTL